MRVLKYYVENKYCWVFLGVSTNGLGLKWWKHVCILNLNGGHFCYYWEWYWKWTGMAWSQVCTPDFHGNTTTQTCALLPTGERANCSGGDQGLWTVHRELRGLTTTGPAVRFKCTAVGFPVMTSLASFWNSESQGFRTWIIMDQSQSTEIEVRICSEHGNFQRKNSLLTH